MKHILHVEYDDDTRSVTATHVPTSYVIVFGMLAYLSKAVTAEFVNISEEKHPARPATAIPGPDGQP